MSKVLSRVHGSARRVIMYYYCYLDNFAVIVRAAIQQTKSVTLKHTSVPDPDLEIRRGAWSSRPLDKGGGGGLPKKIFWPFGPQFDLKISAGGGEGGEAGSATTHLLLLLNKLVPLIFFFLFLIFIFAHYRDLHLILGPLHSVIICGSLYLIVGHSL